MILSFHPCFDTDIQVILADRRLDADDLELIGHAKAIILPQSYSSDLYAACFGHNALIFPNYDVRYRYHGKMGQSLLFRQFTCPHPETVQWKSVGAFKKAYPGKKEFPHKLPFMIKDDRSHEAEGVYLVKNRLIMSEALEQLSVQEKCGQSGFITQEFVPSAGNVLRAVIIGKRVITYWKRPNEPGQLITTISRGAIIDPHWRPDLQEKGKVQAQALSRKTGINLAAIDLVFPLSEQDPEPLFLEINYYFGRRGLGGMEGYYNLLYQAIQDWLVAAGLDPKSVRLL